MEIFQIQQRINELKSQRESSNQQVSEMRLLLSNKQQEVSQLQQQITEHDWDKTQEATELRELEIVLKYLNKEEEK